MSTLGIYFSKNHCVTANLMLNRTIKCVATKQIDIEKLALKNARVIVAIPMHHVVAREFTLPSTLSDDEIILFLKSQSATLFQNTEDELCFDYVVQRNENDNKIIHAVIAHQKEIQTIKTEFLHKKLPLHVIDVDAHALARLTTHSTKRHALIYYDEDRYLIVAASSGKLIQFDYVEPALLTAFCEKLKSLCDCFTFLCSNLHKPTEFSYAELSFESLLQTCLGDINFTSPISLTHFAVPIGLCLWRKS